MKNINYLFVCLFIILFLLTGYRFFTDKKVNIGYVELESLYNDFDMKKELETKFTNVQQARKHILDSLKIQLNALSLSIKSPKELEAIQNFQMKKQEYLTRERGYEEENQNMTQAYSTQIWKQINQYAKDYGKTNEFTVILGGDGSGVLMYADGAKDVTEELTNYINERYKGEEK